MAARTFSPSPPDRQGRRRPSPAWLALALAALWLTAPSPALAHADGDRVVVTGIVSDADGRPLSGLQVTLVATRQTFSVRSFSREIRDTSKVTTKSNERGEYTLEWLWSSYYNHFELDVALPVRGESGDRLSPLANQNVSGRIKHSPVVATVVVADTAFIDAYRAFLAGLDTDSERRVFQSMGKPDRIEIKTAPGREEATWWYFPAGRSFVFENGNLLREVPFTPIKPFAGAAPS